VTHHYFSGGNTFELVMPIIIPVSDHDSMDDLLREIEKGETTIVITKDVRKFRKPVTIVSGLQERKDAKDITRQLKIKIGTGGTFKDNQLILQGDHRETVKDLLAKMGFREDSIEVY
jgi:translation initiation factor 1